MIEINTPLCILVGDHHGEWDALSKKINSYDIRDCLLIHVGDGGEGFIAHEPKQIRQYKLLNDRFKSRNIIYISIRGNHSNKRWFDDSVNYSNFKLISDYTVMKINGEIWQFVGGAISVDRKHRKLNISYWEDEVFDLDKEKAQKCDVLVTHTGPPWIGPNHKGEFVMSFYEKDPTLKSELMEERKFMQDLYDICKPKVSYLGHFHRSEVNTYHGEGYTAKTKILDILELIEHKNEREN